MRHLGKLGWMLVAGSLASAALLAQPPRIVVLPDSDFVWEWGRPTRIDDRDRPDFTVMGREERFLCTLTGAFRPNSRYNDRIAIRDFETSLLTASFFIQDAAQTMYALETSRDIQWAALDCTIPQTEEAGDEDLRQRENAALERARRAQERRRARESD